MTFEEILNSKLVQLPLRQQVEEDDFQEFLYDQLDEFHGYILDSRMLTEDSAFDEKMFRNRINALVKGIKNSVFSYYDGKPFNAYRSLEQAINDSNILGYLPDNSKIKKHSSFYRMRTVGGNFALSRKDMFHPPFQIRGKLGANRYSIPGFPSLYLSSRIYVAWEELLRPNIDDVQVVRVQNEEPLTFLDLTTDRYTQQNYIKGYEYTLNNERWKELYAVMAWPLIAACSVKVKNRQNSFKPEYIIPQLLLQWVRNNRRVTGIRYSSTHINYNNPNITGDYFNLVIPVKENKVKGFCNWLSNTFSVTAPSSWALQQFSSGLQQFHYNRDELKIKTRDLNEKIELSEGMAIPYSQTNFYKMEWSLQASKATLIQSN